MGNTNMNLAKVNKDDEFYTSMGIISNECFNYKDQFKDQIILCNCNDEFKESMEYSGDTIRSDYWLYFYLNFDFFGLKKLITTTYNHNGEPAYKYEYDGSSISKTQMTGNGDFRNNESISLMKEADIIVTSPPFSLFREYIDLLMKYDKKFLIIGSLNAVTYKDVFQNIKNDKIWFGYTQPKTMLKPNGDVVSFGNIRWYTNLDVNYRHIDLFLYYSYDEDKNLYPEFDNYKAINVSKVAQIPYDYDGIMGVPISFLESYNPNQFEIIGMDYEVKNNPEINKLVAKENTSQKLDRGYIDGKRKYSRLLIKRK